MTDFNDRLVAAEAEFESAHRGYQTARDADFVAASERFEAATKALKALRQENPLEFVLHGLGIEDLNDTLTALLDKVGQAYAFDLPPEGGVDITLIGGRFDGFLIQQD